MKTFITHVHALKSASASLGAERISTKAAELEKAGKAGNTDFISEHLPDFAKQLEELVKNIRDALEPDKPENHTAGPQGDFVAPPDSKATLSPPRIPLFNELAGALRTQNVLEIKHILNTLEQQTQDSNLKKTLEQISDQVLMAEFDSALHIIDEALRT